MFMFKFHPYYYDYKRKKKDVSVFFKLITQMTIKQFIFVFRLIFQFNLHSIFKSITSITISHFTRRSRRHYKWGKQTKTSLNKIDKRSICNCKSIKMSLFVR